MIDDKFASVQARNVWLRIIGSIDCDTPKGVAAFVKVDLIARETSALGVIDWVKKLRVM